ncbi:conserved hypothetical protein [Solidesulfovibrio fructosivorans JJ]]|uniref:YkgJ family cysteine cluster protein n=1 Tax=Solidesulfovibrio fructosivorans JJ] TaxID=596151 RepID=E1JZY7_SOLFR|nr:hypothetical protein [Solidesulfovibrio fructosivorans]EFL50082.1 conserved hypothetical protein [Solidesulfovibrio fructosivorans JJ]]
MNALSRSGDSPGSRNPESCRRCAAAGPTCCTLTPGHEELCFPISEVERHRIAEHVGLSLGAFTPEANSGAFLSCMRRLFPREGKLLESLFPESGRHLRLSVSPGGHCVFLQADGCRLPREARPYYCRLFPFWMADGRVTAFAAASCLVHRQGRTVAGMLTLLAATEGQVRDLHGRLRLAWGLPPREDMPAVTPVPARFGT